jgi:hypothetical protein
LSLGKIIRWVVLVLGRVACAFDLAGSTTFEVSLTALTLYWKNGKVATTDGPYAETKEQLGGIQILEARDLNHAVQLVSQQPGFKYGLGPYGLGPIEIRPVVDLSEIIKESEQRRRAV